MSVGLHKSGSPNEVMLDLFRFHSAAYAIVGGSWGLECDGPHAPGAHSVHHNVIIAGPDAVTVDAVAASVMGLNRRDCHSPRWPKNTAWAWRTRK
jgi:uncharacterized protein (DUF362 family)